MKVAEERERLERILRDLELPPGQWVLSGSGVLVLHGLQRAKEMGDVDLFVPTRTWFGMLYGDSAGWGVWTTDAGDPARRHDPPYLYRVMHGLEVNVFYDWRKRGVGDIDVAFWTANAQLVRGWPCIRLEFILDWKRTLGRAKDVEDIALLERHLAA